MWPSDAIREVEDMLSKETVGDIMEPNIVEAPEETTVGDIMGDLGPGQLVVVEDELHLPSCIIPQEVIARQRDFGLPLAALERQFGAPALTKADAPLSDILRGALYDKSIGGYAVLEGGKVLGTVASDAIFGRLAQPQSAQRFMAATPYPSMAISGLAYRLYGESQTDMPEGFCYLCAFTPPSSRHPHRFRNPRKVEHVVGSRTLYCRDHRKHKVRKEVPCQGPCTG
jgi:hypothetical protein